MENLLYDDNQKNVNILIMKELFICLKKQEKISEKNEYRKKNDM